MSDLIYRQMYTADLEHAQHLVKETFDNFERGAGSLEDPPPEDLDNWRQQLKHCHRTDPDGAWVAEMNGKIVGVVAGYVREHLWGGSVLTVDPKLQGQGIGRELFGRALRHGPWARAMFLSSPDPKAMRRYVKTGFELHPTMQARGHVESGDWFEPQEVREASTQDLDLMSSIDAEVRGAARGVDLAEMFRQGTRALILERGSARGYVFLRGGRVWGLSATSNEIAYSLLSHALLEIGPTQVHVAFLSAGQHWAIEALVRAGLDLQPCTPIFTRNMVPPVPYIPAGPFT